MENDETYDVTIERHGTGIAQWFVVHGANLTAIKSGETVGTNRGILIRDRLRKAYPACRLEFRDNGTLRVEAGNQRGWMDVRRIDLYRVILAWKALAVESGLGPNFRETLMRTNRLLYPQEVSLLLADLHLVATVVTQNHGGSPLYSLVPQLGKPAVGATQLTRFLGATDAHRG